MAHEAGKVFSLWCETDLWHSGFVTKPWTCGFVYTHSLQKAQDGQNLGGLCPVLCGVTCAPRGSDDTNICPGHVRSVHPCHKMLRTYCVPSTVLNTEGSSGMKGTKIRALKNLCPGGTPEIFHVSQCTWGWGLSQQSIAHPNSVLTRQPAIIIDILKHMWK